MTEPRPGSFTQQLITVGYRGALRRNYLIQIVNDDLQMLQASTEKKRIALADQRWAKWCEQGVLPRSTFYELLRTWIDSGVLSGRPRADSEESTTPAAATARAKSASYCVDVGISFSGFLQLQAHHQLTDLFRKHAPAFAEGAYRRASSRLGDAGSSDPSQWDDRYRLDSIHVVLIVHAARADASTLFAQFEACVRKALGHGNETSTTPFPSSWVEESCILAAPREVHFGYTDGLSSPRYKDIDDKKDVDVCALFNQHAAGELLLGHACNDGANRWRVAAARAQETTPRRDLPLQPRPATTAYGAFFTDGSFGVLRKMHQNVPQFEQYVQQQALKICGSRNLGYTTGWLKAKLMGRWPNGEPVHELFESTGEELDANLEALLAVSGDGSHDDFASKNHFSYSADADGLSCPYGAHIRRMNPRDDPVVPQLHRPLLRRGAVYGEKYDSTTTSGGTGPDAGRGLLGLFFCANLEEQFEHVLGNWANNDPIGMPYTSPGKDPIIGNHEKLGNSFEIPMRDAAAKVLRGLPAFVETRGTCYAFFPSLHALRTIADGKLETASRFLDSV